ncbi:hypothetical protein VTH8203_00846 [Vibrio thalassae]|uniref:TIGR03750 family conjugal transfer protein n=1 Tax=Vibrio thalassae TaxID=1243014 RepID=A0A240EGZ2_9VIBR|nr:DUF3487 family protein [Vibrio thalassae]SNX47245.1 hypothetical protein VTH8203_00846 [Vibrio thalassae]
MIDEEGTIPVVLDSLDYEAPAIGGLTHKEMLALFTAVFVTLGLTLTPLCALFLGHFAFGLIIAVVVAILLTSIASHRAYVIKQGRPSYMMWVDVKRRIQFKGICGIKLNFGFVESTYWHTGSRNKG